MPGSDRLVSVAFLSQTGCDAECRSNSPWLPHRKNPTRESRVAPRHCPQCPASCAMSHTALHRPTPPRIAPHCRIARIVLHRPTMAHNTRNAPHRPALLNNDNAMIVGAPLVGARNANQWMAMQSSPALPGTAIHCRASPHTAPHCRASPHRPHRRALSRNDHHGDHCHRCLAMQGAAGYDHCHAMGGDACIASQSLHCPHCPASPCIVPHCTSMIFAAGTHKRCPYDRCRAVGGDACIASQSLHCPALHINDFRCGRPRWSPLRLTCLSLSNNVI